MAAEQQKIVLVKNTFFAGLTAAASLLLLLLFMFAARTLGVDALGTLALGMAVGTAVTFGLDLGLNAIAIRRISSSQQATAEVAVQLLLWRLVVSVAFLGVFAPVTWLVSQEPQRSTILVFGLAGVLRSANFSFRALLQATDRFSSEFLVVFLDAVLIVGVGFLVLQQGGGPLAVAWTFVAVRATICLNYALIMRRFVHGVSWRMDWREMWSLQREAWPLGVAVMLSTVFWQIDIVLLSALAGTYATGIFSAAFRIIEGVRVGPDVLANVIYPRLSAWQADNLPRFDDLLSRGCKYVLIGGAALGGLGILFAPELIHFLYGDDYASAVRVMAAVAVIPMVYFFGNFLQVGLRALGRQQAVMIVGAIGLATKTVLALLLIPRYQIDGAIVAAIGGTLAITVAALIVMASARSSALGAVRSILPILIAMAIATGCGYLLRAWSSLVQLAAVLAIFPIMLRVLGVFDRYELELIANLRSKIRPFRRSG
jgi:O-antigen/teichoic acid export membrane protein